MIESKEAYHARRAAMERAWADKSDDVAIAHVHRELAALHEQRAVGNTPMQDKLRLV